MNNASICKAQLELGKKARDKYIKDMEEWNKKRGELYAKETELKEKLDKADDEMAKVPATGVAEATTEGCAADWNEINCYNACQKEFIGVVTPWKNKRSNFFLRYLLNLM